jgi:hypothetical protein
MKIKLTFGLAAGLCWAAIAFGGDVTWTGYISDSHCGAQGGSEKHAHCAANCVKENGASYVFVNDGDRKVFRVDNQDKVAAHIGQHVTVKGTVDGDTLKVASIDTAK